MQLLLLQKSHVNYMSIAFERNHVIEEMDENIFVFFSPKDFSKSKAIFWIKKFR